MRYLLFLPMAPLVIGVALEDLAGAGQANKGDDVGLLQGKWRVASAKHSGANFPKAKAEKMFVAFHKDEIRVLVEGTESEQVAKFTLDATTSPKQIDFPKQIVDREWGGSFAKLFQAWRMDGKPITPDD